MSIRLLIADDSSSMRKVLRKAVSMCGLGPIEFVEANDGVEALEIAQKEWIDLIFTDIHMPRMDGLTFIDEMAKHDLLSQTPIVIITSETREEELEKLRQSRANGIVKKPFRVEDLKSILQEILGTEAFNADFSDEFEGSDF